MPKKIKTVRNFTFQFSTEMNEMLKFKVRAQNSKEAEKKLLRDFPTAFNIKLER